MKQLMEVWSAKPAWLALDAGQQRLFLDEILAKVGPLMEAGLDLVASGVVEADFPNSLPHHYFAFWQAEDPSIVLQFGQVLLDGSWYGYFDQLNISGTAEPLPDVLARHIEVRAVAR